MLKYIVLFLLQFPVIGYASECKLTAKPKEKVCFCHNIKHNPHTICTSNEGLINGHYKHVKEGDDYLGECKAVPSPDPIPSPTPEVSPDPSPTPEPTPPVVIPTPSPEAVPTPSPTPEPSEEPVPSPTPEVVPTDPTPGPEVLPSPEPSSYPEESPDVTESTPQGEENTSETNPCNTTVAPASPLLEGSGGMGCSLNTVVSEINPFTLLAFGLAMIGVYIAFRLKE